MRSTRSARRSSRSTKETGGCSRRRPRAISTTLNPSASSSRASSDAGPHRGGGRYVGSYERDRSRALQLLVQGLDRARSDPDRAAAGRYLLTLAQALMGNRATERFLAAPEPHAPRRPARLRRDSFRLLGRSAVRGTGRARRDACLLPRPRELREGQERRPALAWALAQAAEADPGLLNTARFELAGFLLSQFGTQTIWGASSMAGPPTRVPKPLTPTRWTP